MTELVTTAAGIGWKLLAKLPTMFRWVLRRRFPADVCRRSVIATLALSPTRFEIRQERRMPALCAVEIVIHNYLPFPIVAQFARLEVTIDSACFLDEALTETLQVPASESKQCRLREFGLNDRQVRWLSGLSRGTTSVRFTMYWSCASVVRTWKETTSLAIPEIAINR